MHAIPVLVIKSPVAGLLTVNGHAACEVDGAASLPVGNTGDIFLLFTPYGDYLPVAMRLTFQSGELVMRDYPFPVTVWPDSVAEVELTPKPVGSAMPGRVSDELKSMGMLATLIRQDGFILLIEDEETDALLFRLSMPQASTGSLRELNILGQTVIGALMDEGKGQRLLLFGRDGDRIRLLVDTSGDSIRFEDEAASIRTTRSLGDEAGHGEVRVYQRREDGGYEIASHEYMLEHGSPDTEKTPAGYARAMLEALALGLSDEAQTYISPEYLKQVSIEEIRMFLGAFSDVQEVRYSPAMDEGAALALVTDTARNARTVRIFAFEGDDAGISLIKRYDPQGGGR